MSGDETVRKATRVAQLAHDLMEMRAETTTSEQPVSFWVPGRIEVLGKHTDYGGGRSLLCAIERGICAAALPSVDREQAGRQVPRVRIRDTNSGEMAEIELSPDVAPRPGHWSNYAIAVTRRIATNFSGPMRGADITFASDLPPAAGVSSSSALVIAIFLALSAINNLPDSAEYQTNIRTQEDLAEYLGCVENGLDFRALRGQLGVGTFGGSEDHTAILCSRAGSLAQYSFCPVRFERAIELPKGYIFVIAASGVRAEKTGAALEHYNRVSRRLSVGLDIWNRASGRSDRSMGAAISSAPDARTQIRAALGAATGAEYSSESLLQRFDQFDREVNELIPMAGDALARGDVTAFGEVVARSQTGAELALDNQIPQTVSLVRQARQSGAVAASAFGAGFGGSVWALVEAAEVESFQRRWASAYHRQFPEAIGHSEFFSTMAGPSATKL